MSSLPPNVVGPILQSHLAARQLAAVRDTEDAQRSAALRRQGLVSEAHDSTVETTDEDTQVHTDAEGQGSQGRAFSDADNQEQPTEDTATPTVGDEGRIIDLEA